MKKTLLAGAIFAAAALANLYCQPDWYSDEVTSSVQKVYRIDGIFEDSVFTACSSAALGDEVNSLEKARDKAIKNAWEKIISKSDFSEEGSLQLLHCQYDENPASGGAYVQISITYSIPVAEEDPVPPTSAELLKKNTLILPMYVDYNDCSYTLISNVVFEKKSKKESHGVIPSEKLAAAAAKAENVTFRYADRTPITDGLVTLNEDFSFVFKNCIKRRPTLVVIRVDSASECEEATFVYRDVEVTEKITHSAEHGWQNIVFELEEGLLNDYTPEFLLKTGGKSISIGSIYIYQQL